MGIGIRLPASARPSIFILFVNIFLVRQALLG
jgi:hypothetical protein